MDGPDLIRIIREIGRGRNAARDLSREDARALFAAKQSLDPQGLLNPGVLIG